jgi:hypothetical protein
LTDGGNWHTATNSFELQREAYSRYRAASLFPLSAGWLTTISYLQRTPHLILAADTSFFAI